MLLYVWYYRWGCYVMLFIVGYMVDFMWLVFGIDVGMYMLLMRLC